MEFFNQSETKAFADMAFDAPIKHKDGRYFIAAKCGERIMCKFDVESQGCVGNDSIDLKLDTQGARFIKDADDAILGACKEFKSEWFPGKDVSDEQLEDNVSPSLKRNSKVIKVRLSNAFALYNSKKEVVDRSEIAEGQQLKAIIQLAGIWFTKSRFGISWLLVQGMLPSQILHAECMFEEDNITDNVFPSEA